MKNTSILLIVALTGCMFSAAAFSQANTAKVEINAGLRSGRFHAAPSAESLWLQETSVGGYSPTQATLGSVALSTGGNVGVSQMRGNLGPGLTSFSGYRVNPALRFDQSLANLLPRLGVFSAIGYAYAQYTGRGSNSWDANTSPSLFLLGSESLKERGKKYVAHGPNVAGGVSYGITQSFSVSTTVAVAFETMTSDSPIFIGGKEISDRESTSFTSRSLTIGGGYTL